jgi:dehydrodolichyl diphosphate syntase complex subunit NUS1
MRRIMSRTACEFDEFIVSGPNVSPSRNYRLIRNFFVAERSLTMAPDLSQNQHEGGNGGSGRGTRTANILSAGVQRNSKFPAEEATLKQLRFVVLYVLLQIFYALFSVYHLFVAYYRRLGLRLATIGSHTNRTPQWIRRDVMELEKIPRHLAVILNLKEINEEGGGIKGLLSNAGEVATWCIGAGIQTLSIYESTGALKKMDTADVHRSISKTLQSYFGSHNCPNFSIRVPQQNSSYANGGNHHDIQLTINLISQQDGREAIVEMTRTLADMAVHHKIGSQEISIDVIDNQLRDLVMDEPDLLIIFGPVIDLQGFPPWHIRLSEIFYLPDIEEVSYAVFLKALQKYATCKINVGR